MVIAVKRVLLVEDIEADYLIARDLLAAIAAERFEVEWVKSAVAARQALNARKYDVCLINHHLGGRDGLKLIEERETGAPPFILLTDEQSREVDIAAGKAGAMDYLVKGHISAPLLESSIRYAIERAGREKALEAALQHSQLLAAAVSNLTDGMIVTDAQAPDRPLVFVNAAFCEITGYSPEESIGRNCRFLQGPETDPQVVAQIREAVREQRPYSGVIRNYRKDGSPFWNGIKITPVFDAQGKLINFVGLLSDITARRQAEIALHESESRKAAILESALDGILTIDHQNAVVEFNPAAEKIFGYSRAEAIGRSVDELIAPPRPREGQNQTLAALLSSEEGGVLNRQIEMIGLCADGTEFPAELALTQIQTQGESLFTGYIRNISERKHAEEKLRHSEANLRVAQQIAQLGSWEMDLTENQDSSEHTVRWSDETLRIFGCQPGEIEASKENVFRCVHPDDQELVQNAMERALREEQPFEVEHRVVWPDGTERLVHAQAKMLRDEVSGVPLKMVGICQDITERRHAEKVSSQLVAIVESSEDAIVSKTLDGIITTWNTGAQTLYGYSADEAIGQPISILVPAEIADEVPRLLQQIRCGEPVTQHETTRIRKDGTRLNISLSISPLRNAEGRIIGASSIKRDITQRKVDEQELRRANELLEAVTEGTTDAVFAKDREGRYLMMNQACASFLGHPAEKIVGKTDNEIFGTSGVHDFSHADLRVLEKGEVQSSEESLLIDGTMHTFLATKGPMRDPQGNIVGIVGISRDITGRKQTESALREREEFQRTLLENFPNGSVYVFNRDFECLAIANRDMESKGMVIRDFVGQALDSIVSPENATTLKEYYQRVFEGESIEFEFRNGSRVHSVVAAPLRDAQGDIPRIIAVSQEITARKQAEAQRDRFFTLSLDMLSIVGLDGYFKRVSPAFTEVLGWSEAELLARPYADFVHPDDLEATQEVAAELSGGNSVAGFENRYRAKNGSWHWLEWKSVTVVEEGLIYAAARDVTERKRNETALARTNDELETRVAARTLELEQSERQTLARARQHEAMAELGKQALSDIDLDTLLQGAVALVAATLDVELCSFWELMPHSTTLQLRATVGRPGGMITDIYTEIGDGSQIGHTALINEAVIIEDLARQNQFSAWPIFQQLGIASVATMPVKDGSLYGVIAASSTQSHRFNQNDKYFLQAIANVLASAIARKHAETEILQLNGNLQGANEELRFNETRLLQGNRTFADLTRLRATDDEELRVALHQITEAGSEMLDVERCSVWTFDSGGTILRCLDLYERDAHRHSEGFELEEDKDYFPTIKSRHIVVADDALADPVLQGQSEVYLKPHGITSVLDVALTVGGQTIGVLCCAHTGAPREWQTEDQTFANSVASACSLVLESYQREAAEAASRHARHEAEQARQEAEAANEAKSEFLSRMSHELRTPLNSILGFGQILDRQQLSELQKESIGYILKGGRHLLDLINEVLDIARVEAGQMELSIEPVALPAVVSECCALVSPLAQDREIQIVDDSGQNADYYAMADRQRLKQVLLNLLSNAIKYNRQGGTVTIFVTKADDLLQLRVSDTGEGLSAPDLEKLFMPFERLQAADSQIEGTGLGLVLSQHIVAAMGGTLSVESQLGEGTTFWIELPQTNSPLDALSESLPQAPLQALPEGEQIYTVLSIEDNLSNIRLLETILASRPDIKLLAAMQGSLGLDLARQHHPDAILLDLNLPGISGSEVLEQLRASDDTRDIPVVVISADATKNQIERLLAAGALAYLTKPIDVANFLNTLDEVLGIEDAHPTP